MKATVTIHGTFTDGSNQETFSQSLETVFDGQLCMRPVTFATERDCRLHNYVVAVNGEVLVERTAHESLMAGDTFTIGEP